ncbi:hypothetical protein ABRP70_19885 [Pectobacterium odoriferum]|uniref:hypothetical protein n=1 Tax=Pectobacterium odoriferum TaxID=78398 RepID=UPI0032EB6BC1
MPSLGMGGVHYELTSEEIDRMVTRTSAGNYALGNISSNGLLNVKYVGRADSDLNDRLKDHVGESVNYTHFKFLYATSSKAAFEKECHNYHDFGGNQKLNNRIHPDRPSNSKQWECPVCDAFDEKKAS